MSCATRTADRRERIAALKKQLDAAALARADRSRGRAIFDRVCASCHKLYGYGGEIGPDLTGAGRDNLDYLLENLSTRAPRSAPISGWSSWP